MRTSTRKNSHNGHRQAHMLAADWVAIKNALSDTAGDVKDEAGYMLRQSLDEIRRRSENAQDRISTYTAKKPLKSLGIAVLVGIAVGFLLKR